MDGTILGKKYDIIGGSGGGGHITPATTETLGGVIVGDGLSVTEDGVLSANSQTWNYSTSEVNTGQKWIDGKDIFCKVYTTPLGNNTTITLEENFAPAKTLVKIEPTALTVDNDLHYQFTMGTMTSMNDIIICEVFADNLQVVVRDNYGSYTGYFAVYYTKTEV